MSVFKSILLCFLSVFSFTTVLSQDLTNIKVKTDTYSGLLTANKLANKISGDFTSEAQRVKAVFCWLTKNIRYDLEEYYNPTKTGFSFKYKTIEERDRKLLAMKDSIVKGTLTSRKGVCEGYAQTFSKVCDLLNIENEIIEGYVRTSSRSINVPLANSNHAWNAVKINDKWIYIDATWGAGYEMNGKWLRNFNSYFYNIPKSNYFKTHLPEQSIWRLRMGKRITKEAFYAQPIYSNYFLTTKVTLRTPTNGVLNRNKEGNFYIALDNVKGKEIHVGFIGTPSATKPLIKKKKNTAHIYIAAPNSAKQLFLLVDREVALEFKLN